MNEALGPFCLVLLAIPAIALRIALRALFGRKRHAAGDPMHVLLSLSSTIMFVMAGLGVAIGLLGFWFLLIPLPFVGLILVLLVMDRTRRAEHRGLIWALAAAANRGIPLPEAARAYADETAGDTGARAMALAINLERGQPLAQAAQKARLRMGTSMKLAVRLGESLSSLGPAMRQQLTELHESDAVLRLAIGRFMYLGIVVAMLITTCTFMMFKIVPVFQKMFEEFGLKLPAMTQLVVNLSASAGDFFAFIGIVYLMVTGVIAIAVIVAIPVAAAMAIVEFMEAKKKGERFTGKRTAGRIRLYRGSVQLALIVILFWPFLILVIPFLYYAGWFPRNLPVVWRLFRRYDGALLMRGLALAIRRGLALPPALRLVAENYPLSIIGSRMEKAAQQVEAGREWCACLTDAGLIGATDAAVLRAAERTGNLHWALEEMADSALRRQALRMMAVFQLVFPAGILLVGMIVFLFVCGLFLPLISLIQGLT